MPRPQPGAFDSLGLEWSPGISNFKAFPSNCNMQSPDVVRERIIQPDKVHWFKYKKRDMGNWLWDENAKCFQGGSGKVLLGLLFYIWGNQRGLFLTFNTILLLYYSSCILENVDEKGRGNEYQVVYVQRHLGKRCPCLQRILSCLVGLKCWVYEFIVINSFKQCLLWISSVWGIVLSASRDSKMRQKRSYPQTNS